MLSTTREAIGVLIWKLGEYLELYLRGSMMGCEYFRMGTAMVRMIFKSTVCVHKSADVNCDDQNYRTARE